MSRPTNSGQAAIRRLVTSDGTGPGTATPFMVLTVSRQCRVPTYLTPYNCLHVRRVIASLVDQDSRRFRQFQDRHHTDPG